MGIREDRAAAIRRRFRELADDYMAALPKLLDDLDAIDDAHPGSELAEARAEAAELRQECDSLAELLVEAAAERDALRGGLAAGPLPPAAPVKPAPRRRTRT